MNPALAAITLVLAGALPACSGETVDPDLQGVASVIDGDTIEIHGARIRLNGIDAPESGQLCQAASRKTWRCGQQAALTLSDRIGRQVVSCQQTDTDRYGRVVADCYAGRENLNRWMVREGWAVAYRQYSTAYLAAEDDARTDQRGIWQGLFDMPWDWRAERRSGQDTAPPMSRLYEVAGQNWSCSPLRTCSQIGSCDEARWYLQNCPGAASLTATMTASPARASAERLRRAGRPGIVSGAMDT